MANHAPSARPAIGLALPFAAVGLAGSLLLAVEMLNVLSGALLLPHEAHAGTFCVIVVAVVTSLTAGVGALIGRSTIRSFFLNGLVLTSAVGIAAAMAGVASTLVARAVIPRFDEEPPLALAFGGAWLALVMAPLFWMPLMVVLAARHRAQVARPRSVLAGAERQRVWAVTAFVIALGSALVVLGHGMLETARASLALTVGAVLVLASLVLVAARRLMRVTAIARGVEKVTDPRDVATSIQVDLGVGEELWVSRTVKDDPYRGTACPETGVRGAVFDAQRRLTWTLLTEGALFVGGLMLLLVIALHREPTTADYAPPMPATIAPAEQAPVAEPARSLAWYPLTFPVLADVDGDGQEDVVGLRWDSADESRALSLVATDGKTLTTRWRTEPIASQWANPQVRLVRSGDHLYVSDSEKLIHAFDLASGRELFPATPLPAEATLECGDERSGDPTQAWLANQPWVISKRVGFLVKADDGFVPAQATPDWCLRPGELPRCSAKTPAETVCETERGAPWTGFIEVRDLQEGRLGIAVGRSLKGDAPPAEPDRLAGYDPKTRHMLWEQPVAVDAEAHDFPSVQVALAAGRAFTFYQLRNGHWELSARDARSGQPLWKVEPPRAMEGTSFDSLTVSAQGVYLALSNRMEVFDPATGASRGVIW
jgi:hypothetical protein